MKIKDFNLREINNEELFELLQDDLFNFFKAKKLKWNPFIRFDAVELSRNRCYDMGFVNDGASNKVRKRALSVMIRYLLGNFNYECYCIEISSFACEVFEDKVGSYGKSSVKFEELDKKLSKKLRQFMRDKNAGDDYEQWCEFYLNAQEKEEHVEV